MGPGQGNAARGGRVETLDIDELAKDPDRLRQYYGNGGVTITAKDGRVIAEVPPAFEPAPPDADELTIVDSDWLD